LFLPISPVFSSPLFLYVAIYFVYYHSKLQNYFSIFLLLLMMINQDHLSCTLILKIINYRIIFYSSVCIVGYIILINNNSDSYRWELQYKE
jgi:hypothetical protein